MRKLILTLSIIGLFSSCQQQEKADLIVINANAYTVNEGFDKAESFAIKDGKFIGVGSNDAIQNKFVATETIDAKNQTVVPGLIDAHCHFFGLGLSLQKIDLRDTKSYDEILEKLVAFKKEKNADYITGRGWDQNDWEVKEFPTKEKLDKLFPNTPVAIRRVDGHALLVNEAALKYSGLSSTKFPKNISGGEFIQERGKLTGVLIDAAMRYIKTPNTTKKESIQGLLDAQKVAFSYGLTTVDDAGVGKSTIDLMDSLQKTGDLKMRIYAMVSVSQKNLDYFIPKGIIKTDRLNVRSFKVYGDGALGSRGAAMRKSYSDRDHHYGAMIFEPKRYTEIAAQIAKSDYQMNTHAIGDSANTHILKTYKVALKGQKDRRWKIEHAQIISPEDFDMFDNIVPS
ncbi:MAG: putative amidohydrolase YtcJ, partial [Polaribacter sp.]